MRQQKLFKFSAIMFFAAAIYLLLSAATQPDSRIYYLAVGTVCLIFGVLISARARG